MQKPDDDIGYIYPGTGFPDGFPLSTWISSQLENNSESRFPNLIPGFNFSPEQFYFNYTEQFSAPSFSQNNCNFGFDPVSFQFPPGTIDSLAAVNTNTPESTTGNFFKAEPLLFGINPSEAFLNNITVESASTNSPNQDADEDVLEKYLDWDRLTTVYSPSSFTGGLEGCITEQKNPKVPIKRLRSSSPIPKSKKTQSSMIGKPKSKTPQTLIERKYRDSLIHGINELKEELPLDPMRESSNAGNKRAPKLNKSSVLRRATEYIQELKSKTQSLEKEKENLKGIILSLPGGAQRLEKLVSIPSPPEISTDANSNYSSPPGTQYLMVSFGCLGLFHFSDTESYGYSPEDDFSVYSLVIFSLVLFFFFFCLYMIFSSLLHLFKDKPKTTAHKSSNRALLSPTRDMSSVLLLPYLLKEGISIGASLVYYKISPPSSTSFGLSSEKIYLSTKCFLEASRHPGGYFHTFCSTAQCLRYLLQLFKFRPASNRIISGEIYTSLSLLVLAYFRRSYFFVKMAKHFLAKSAAISNCGLLSQDDFFDWLISEDLSFPCHPLSQKSINSWLCDAFYLAKVEKLSADYLSKPESTPSLRSIFSEVISNPLILEGSRCLTAILRLETMLAFLNDNPQYGIKLSISLIELLMKHPEAFSDEDSLAIKGVFGCALIQPSLHQNINAGVSLLDAFLNGVKDASVSPILGFLTLHLAFTQRLAVLGSQENLNQSVCPESLVKSLAKLRFDLRSLRSNIMNLCSDQALSSLPDSLIELASFYTIASKKLSLYNSLG